MGNNSSVEERFCNKNIFASCFFIQLNADALPKFDQKDRYKKNRLVTHLTIADRGQLKLVVDYLICSHTFIGVT